MRVPDGGIANRAHSALIPASRITRPQSDNSGNCLAVDGMFTPGRLCVVKGAQRIRCAMSLTSVNGKDTGCGFIIDIRVNVNAAILGA